MARSKNGAPLPQRGSKQSIALGLVNVQVRLKKLADPAKPVSGHLFCGIHDERIKLLKWCEAHSHDVADPVKRYEASNGAHVEVPEDEIEQLLDEKTKTLTITRWVEKVDEIDPIYYGDHYLVFEDPDGPPAAIAAFDLLRETIRQMGGAALGNVVMSKLTQMVVLRFSETTQTLIAETCHYDSWLRWNDVQLVAQAAAARPPVQQQAVDMAEQLLRSVAGPFDSTLVDDTFYPALKQLIETYAAGKTPPTPKTQAEPASPVVDLMEALRQSVANQGAAKKAKPATAKKATPRKKQAA